MRSSTTIWIPWLASLVWIAACSERRALQQLPPQSPRKAVTTSSTRTKSAGFLGVVLAPATVDLSSQLESRLKSIRVRTGDRVSKDQVIARLDARAAHKEIAIAKAALLSALADQQRAELEAAEADEKLKRRTGSVELPSGGSAETVSKEELASAGYQQKLARVKLDIVKAAVVDKRARIAELRTLAEEGEIRAPFNGVVAQRYVDEGAIVRKGSPIIRLIESSKLRVRFAVPEDAIRAVAAGVRIRVATDDLELSGVVEKVAPEIDAAARMIFADASLEVPVEQASRVRSGQVARVWTVGEEHASR